MVGMARCDQVRGNDAVYDAQHHPHLGPAGKRETQLENGNHLYPLVVGCYHMVFINKQ